MHSESLEYDSSSLPSSKIQKRVISNKADKGMGLTAH